MIDFSKSKFSSTPFSDKKQLCSRYRAIKKLCEDAQAIDYSINLIPYSELKLMELPSIKLYFELIVKQFFEIYREHIAENL